MRQFVVFQFGHLAAGPANQELRGVVVIPLATQPT